MVKYVNRRTKVKNWHEFILQLFINLIVPILAPSGAISLLVIFKERLPSPLYTILIWLFWLLIVVIIIRFVFGDAINRIVKYIKKLLLDRKRADLLRDWYKNFVSLLDIVSSIATTTGDWDDPSDEQLAEYTRLQMWFRDNRGKCIPIWLHFRRNRPDSSYIPNTSSLEYKIIHLKEDAFSCFYEPLTLDRLGLMMRHEFGTNNGDSVRYVLAKLQELVAELIEWDKSRR